MQQQAKVNGLDEYFRSKDLVEATSDGKLVVKAGAPELVTDQLLPSNSFLLGSDEYGSLSKEFGKKGVLAIKATKTRSSEKVKVMADAAAAELQAKIKSPLLTTSVKANEDGSYAVRVAYKNLALSITSTLPLRLTTTAKFL